MSEQPATMETMDVKIYGIPKADYDTGVSAAQFVFKGAGSQSDLFRWAVSTFAAVLREDVARDSFSATRLKRVERDS